MKAIRALTGRSLRSCLLGAAAAGLALVAVPATANTEFTGGGFLTGFSSGCGNSWQGTAQFVTRLRPAGLPQNPSGTTSIALFFETYSLALDVSGLPALDTWTNVSSYTSISGVGARNTSPNPVPQIRFTSRPSSFDTAEMALVMEIRNLDMISNCNARARMTLYRR